jgi:hypothetical protein
VNTGRYVGRRDLEETVLKTNLEAVQEIVHQLRFRNIGGLIIMDLIDMESADNREKVYRALQDALRHDKSKTNILKISELGLVEMTRKRTRENLVQQLCESCSYCEGRGYVLSPDSVAFKILREIRKDLPRFCGRQVAVAVSPLVAETLLGPARKALAALGEELGREIEVRARPSLHQEQFELEALGEGPPIELSLGWLVDPKPEGTRAAGEERHELAAAPPGPETEAGAETEGEELAEGAAAAAPLAPEATPVPSGAGSPQPAWGVAAALDPPAPPLAEGLAEGPLETAGASPDVLDSPAESPILPRSEEHEES